MTKGSYTKAALKGYGSYTKAALKGYGSYTKAALKGYGKSYTKAALKGYGKARGQKLVKGSPEAKAYMAHLRSLRGKGTCGRKKKLRGGALDIGAIIKNFQTDETNENNKSLIGELKDVWEGPVGDAVKTGVGFWGNWIGENVKNNRSMDEEIADLEKKIKTFKRLPPDEQDAVRKQIYKADAAQHETFQPIHDMVQGKLKIGKNAVKRLKEAQKKARQGDEEIPPPPPMDDEDGEIPPPPPMEDDDEIPPPPPMEQYAGMGYCGGKFIPETDLRDAALGPYGWIAMGVRKKKEKKLARLRKEWNTLIYGPQ